MKLLLLFTIVLTIGVGITVQIILTESSQLRSYLITSSVKRSIQNIIKKVENNNDLESSLSATSASISTSTKSTIIEIENKFLNRNHKRLDFSKSFTFVTTEKVPVDKIKEAANAVKLFVAETIYDVSNIVEKFSIGVYRTASAFAADTLQLFILARDNLQDVIRLIATKILEIDDEIVKEFFEDLKDTLENIKKVFINIIGQAEKEFENILNHVNDTLMLISEDMEDWSDGIKMKLRTVKDNEIYKKGCNIVDKFVSSSVEEAYECCNIAIKPMKSICNNAKDIIGDTLNILVDILEKVEICVLEKKARIHIMIACLDDAYDKFAELMKHASDLKESLFKTLPTKIMLSNFCFSMAAVSVEVRKIDISNEIQEKYLN